jgi:methylmalonyl-CoA mutase
MAYTVDDLDAALAGVDLNLVPVTLEAGAAFVPAAAALVALWRRRGIAADQAHGAFNADPLAVLAFGGKLPFSTATALSLVGDLAGWTAKNYPHVTAVGVDTTSYHSAGATASQDVAIGLATATEYLRAMTAAGLDLDSAARQIQFQVGLGTHHFLAICKLRAARRLWWRIVEASGGSPSAGAMRINARTGKRVLTKRDPYVNLLRNTVGVFAAGVGGADSITSVPFDATIGQPDDFSRRVARNTLLVLQEEAHLHKVIDPAGGSWFLDRLTQQLAEEAWGIFQKIERQGGMLKALTIGWIATEIETTFTSRAKDIARRKEGITGVSEFPDVAEQPVVASRIDVEQLRKAAIDRLQKQRGKSTEALDIKADEPTESAVAAAAKGTSIGQIARALGFHKETTEISPLELRGFAEPFEQLRDASDAWYAQHGKRPAVFLANMGPVSHYTARATYSKNFFEAGGFAVATNSGFPDADAAAKAFAASGAPVAVICSSDKLYPDLVPQLAGKLKAAGAKSVVLAGNPGANEQAWRAAGVDKFIYVKCDVLVTLREILREQGVLPPQSQST